jgi:cAMP-dependent protein kinase regulator
MFNKKEDFQARKIPKTEEQIQRIKARILQSFLFSNLESKDLNIVIDAMEEKKVEKGEVVIKQGENGDCLFFIEEGTLDCFKRFPNTTEDKFLKEYQPGEAFGELALLYNAPRAATCICKTNCILWVLDRECFNHIVKDSAQKKREKYENFLRSVEILAEIDAFEIGQIADALRSSSYSKGEFIIREGELGDVFYIIENGNAAATKTFEPGKPPLEVKTYKAGDYFGELALIKGDPRAANIIATSDVKVISLDRNSFKRLLGPMEDILKRNSDSYVKYIK